MNHDSAQPDPTAAPSIPDLLRRAKRSGADAPAFDPATAPADPLELAAAWLVSAVEAGVTEPQALVLSTATPAAGPDARTLLLKDLDDAVWFSTSSLSPKGRQIAADPRVALTFYWREQGRQIRILGVATPGPQDRAAADFTARHPDSRAVVLALPQSDPIDDEGDADSRLADAKQRISAEPDFVPPDWTVYRVDPTSVEFWQATTGRDQVRLRYDRASPGAPWTRAALWP